MPISVHTARLGRKAQVVLPKQVREALGLKPGDRIAFVVDGADVRVAHVPEGVEPFEHFSEWASEADTKGYSDL